MPDTNFNKKEKYTAKDIEVLKGLEPVRKHPGMYIGGTDDKALHHLASELLDNAMDEVLSGFASNIDIVLIDSNTLSINDNGRGIPIDPHPLDPSKSAVEVICTYHQTHYPPHLPPLPLKKPSKTNGFSMIFGCSSRYLPFFEQSSKTLVF